MSEPLQDLADCRVLVVEDEYLIALDLAQLLHAHGAVLLGPVPTIEKALALMHEADRIDDAVIDINLQEQKAYPIADALEARGEPFVFATGYSTSLIQTRYQYIPRWEKPYHMEKLVQSLPALIQRS